tara:strand:+ start:60 stop:380 length:321 start_codon:yes stop_codon:yes gene_type:complete
MRLPTITVSLTILIIVILFIFTRSKPYDYNKIRAKEYNVEYSLNYPVIDSLDVLYNENKAILIRRFEVDGHSVIGEINGGSRVLTIHDLPTCKKCNDYFVSLKLLK